MRAGVGVGDVSAPTGRVHVWVYMRVGAVLRVRVCGCQWPRNSRLVWSSEQQGRKPAPSTGLLSGVADYGYVCPSGSFVQVCGGVGCHWVSEREDGE